MYKLVTMQNIASELEEKEFDAWQTLIRVLTHEIMNSVTPILSLSSTTNLIIKRQIENAPDENLEDIREALETIEKRSKGLLSFVESYRRLTRIPNPDIKVVSVKELFSRLHILYEQTVADKTISLDFNCEPETLEMMADLDLIEQVLINLLKNAVEALEGVKDPAISVSAIIDYLGKINLKISDNGAGMSDEVREKIFIPFYTTKEEGSGIGLSLSRQIIRLHGGSISVQSTPNQGTVFTLIL